MLFQSMILKALVAALSVTTTFAAAVPEKRSTPKVVLFDFRVEKTTVELPLLSNGVASDGAQKRDVIPITIPRNQILYLLEVDVGSQAETITLQLDTGSSNMLVPLLGATCPCGEEARYDPHGSNTSQFLNEPVHLLFGTGHADGYFYSDTVRLTQQPQVSLKNLQFAGINSTDLAYGYLGVGLDNGEYAPEYENLPATLKSQGYVDKNAYSLYLGSATSTHGTILFGGKDTSKYQGELKTLPLSHPFRLAVALESISFGNFTVPGKKINSLFDSGATYTYLAPAVFEPLAERFGWTEHAYGRYLGPCDGDDVVFDFGFDTKVTIPYELLVFPYDGKNCTINILKNEQEEIFNTLGDNFLRSVYTVFDLDNRELQVAPVVYTKESNIVPL